MSYFFQFKKDGFLIESKDVWDSPEDAQEDLDNGYDKFIVVEYNEDNLEIIKGP